MLPWLILLLLHIYYLVFFQIKFKSFSHILQEAAGRQKLTEVSYLGQWNSFIGRCDKVFGISELVSRLTLSGAHPTQDIPINVWKMIRLWLIARLLSPKVVKQTIAF